MYYSLYNSPLGIITLYCEDNYLTGLYLEGQKNKIDNSKYLRNDDLKIFKDTKKWLDMYFAKEIPNLRIDIKLKGTEFQIKVWNQLQEVPYGKTVTYKDIRDKLDSSQRLSCRAVGNAINKNPISIIVPCHRVIGSNNKLVGYNGGIEYKKYLLNIEK